MHWGILLSLNQPVSFKHTQILLEQLHTTGDVRVARGPAPAGFPHGFTWTITFETQIENINLLEVNGNSTTIPIVGPGVHLAVVELQRGRSPSLDLDITGLEPGVTYATRVSAKNAAGYGPDTVADASDGGDRGSNNDGLGVSPFVVGAIRAPSTPVIAGIAAVSASQLEVSLEAPVESPGADVLGYKVRDSVLTHCLRWSDTVAITFMPRGRYLNSLKLINMIVRYTFLYTRGIFSGITCTRQFL